MATEPRDQAAPKHKPTLRPARTLADSVSARLTEEIVTGARPPGSRLDENTIAQHFQVSRTPVREALRQLTASELVEWRPRQGAVVATISAHQMVAMFEIMAEYEGIAGRFAARRMSEDERAALQEHHKRCEPYAVAKDRENYQRLNRSFHIALYEGSHNSYLCAQATALYDRLAPYRTYELNRPGELMRVFREHAAIVDAIVARDADAARRIAGHHIAQARAAYLSGID
jgi:DNA-binding GntR family transcriptional regulator